MPLIDKKKFPNIVILMENEPDDIKLYIKGVNQFVGPSQMGEASIGALGVDKFLDTQTLTEIVTKSQFTQDHPDGRKRAIIPTPFSQIRRVFGYAKREDLEDDTPVNIEMFATGKQRNPSGVWAVRFALTKQQKSANYVATHTIEQTDLITFATSFISSAAGVVAAGLAVVQTDPKALVAKFLAPAAAAAMQQIIAFATEQKVKYGPLVAKILTVIQLVQQAAADPLGVAVILFGYLVDLVTEEDLANIGVWFFKGGA